MTFDPHVYFVTPVYKRFPLAKACLEQRREMLDALPFQASQVVIGDEPEHKALAESLGFDWVEYDNNWVSAKFNAGYRHAMRRGGASHVMPLGSDSFLHPDAFDSVRWHPREALGLLGLSSVSPYGDERIDFMVKYPAGFGVGMVYPVFAIQQGGGADPHRNRGIDSSTWSRCGRGRVQIKFHENPHASYINFHSPVESITDYASIRASYRRNGKTSEPWSDLREKYGDANVEAVQEVYAVHSLGVFISGMRQHRVDEPPRRTLPGHRGRRPARDPNRRIDGSVRTTRAKREARIVQSFEDAQG